METIINKIKSILDDKMLKAELHFDNMYTAYIGTLKKEAQLSYGYFFDLRKKNRQDYYLLDISLSILQKEIAHISNQVKVKSIEKRNIPDQLKKRLLKSIKKSAPIIGGVYNWRELDTVFQTTKVQNCYINDSSEIEGYKDELITLFENGQKWVQKVNDWNFLVQWNIKNNNALQALCILKYLNRKEDFKHLKDESILKYKVLNLPIDELENIEW
ncbi:hypothetical protein [Treponema pedis]|uniref:Uncharacterized protein n=1 Tax=Treponema pedis str. T A4 TaxID=1291379 RepID=S5ZWA8_9SPIR|nr:hypothetical protein [Treponema pedis]AGT44645.1 hypothetical protein TPE_2171 [Treponema pedis str. T A4]QSI05312.1 hypothetical protein DYQ05_10510 [Treponema pedis]